MTFRNFLKIYTEKCEKLNLEYEAVKLLVLELSKYNGADFLMHIDDEIEESLLRILEEAVNRYIVNFEPVQHILGYSYFYGYKFKVSKDVLIPRPETEELVGYVLEYYDEIFKNKKVKVCDVGTGSGCIAVSLAKEEPNMELVASDISEAALEIAKYNALSNNANVTFYQGNMLDELIKNNLKFDILVSNPPYIDKSEDIDPLVEQNEPHLALYAENLGMQFYEEILSNAKHIMNTPNIILFEHGYKQRQFMLNLIDKYYPNSDCEIIKDLSGNDRFTIIINK